MDTLERRKDFAATYKRGAEGGRKSLRRMQFESANRGNVVMQIWQYLGQADDAINQVRKMPSFRELTLSELCEGLKEFGAANPDLVAAAQGIDPTFEILPRPANRALPPGSSGDR